MRSSVICIFLLSCFWALPAAGMGAADDAPTPPLRYEDAPGRRGRASLDPQAPGVADEKVFGGDVAPKDTPQTSAPGAMPAPAQESPKP